MIRITKSQLRKLVKEAYAESARKSSSSRRSGRRSLREEDTSALGDEFGGGELADVEEEPVDWEAQDEYADDDSMLGDSFGAEEDLPSVGADWDDHFMNDREAGTLDADSAVAALIEQGFSPEDIRAALDAAGF